MCAGAECAAKLSPARNGVKYCVPGEYELQVDTMRCPELVAGTSIRPYIPHTM